MCRTSGRDGGEKGWRIEFDIIDQGMIFKTKTMSKSGIGSDKD